MLGWLGLALPAGAAAYLGLRPALRAGPVEQPERIPLCRKADVPADGVRLQPVSWTVRRGAVTEPQILMVFVERTQDGGIRALSARCPHTGCRVESDQDGAPIPDNGGSPKDDGPGYLCRCHNARFSASGAVLSGPPPRGLDELPLEIPEGDDEVIHWLRS